MEFNYLERTLDDLILEIMNERGEDSRVWIFLEAFSTERKISILSKLYDLYFSMIQSNEKLKNRKIELFRSLNEIRVNRNIYIHANWLNEFNGDLVEWKTKRIRNGEYGRVHKLISISDLDKDLTCTINIHAELDEFHEELTQSFYSS